MDGNVGQYITALSRRFLSAQVSSRCCEYSIGLFSAVIVFLSGGWLCLWVLPGCEECFDCWLLCGLRSSYCILGYIAMGVVGVSFVVDCGYKEYTTF